MTRVRGSVALVTGASGGLGRAIAEALAAGGANLVLTGRRREPLEQLAARTGGRALVADLARREELDRLLEEAGPLDIVVMNAALPASGDLGGWEQAHIDRALEVNLASPIAMTRALLPSFRARGSGHFVYISSVSGLVASPGTALYSATKYGLRGFAGGLRADLHGSGVGCSVVFPGFVSDAGMFAATGAQLSYGLRTVSPDQVTAAVLKALRTDRAEIVVAPLALRLGALFGAFAPGLTGAVQARLGRPLADEIAAAQRHLR